MLSERHRASDRDRAWSRVRLVVVGVAATLLGVILLAARPVPANAGTGPRCSGLPATIVGTPGDDTLVGTAERDVIVGLGGDDVIRGGASADVICAGRGRDILFGGASTHHRRSTAHGISRPAADFIDIVDGGRGDDVIRGGRGDDWLFAGRGDDLVLGGHGDEIIGVSRGHDTYVGGRGRDSLAFSSHLRCCSITVNLTTGRVFGAGFVGTSSKHRRGLGRPSRRYPDRKRRRQHASRRVRRRHDPGPSRQRQAGRRSRHRPSERRAWHRHVHRRRNHDQLRVAGAGGLAGCGCVAGPMRCGSARRRRR